MVITRDWAEVNKWLQTWWCTDFLNGIQVLEIQLSDVHGQPRCNENGKAVNILSSANAFVFCSLFWAFRDTVSHNLCWTNISCHQQTNQHHITLRYGTTQHSLHATVTLLPLNSVGRPFFYRIQAARVCCPPCRREGACEETGWACPPLPVLGEYLCSVTRVPGTRERLGTGQ